MKRQIMSSISAALLIGLTYGTTAQAGMYVKPENRNGGGGGYHGSYNSGPFKPSARSYPFADTRPATGKPVFIYNPKSLSWGAYNAQGELVKVGPGSGGRDYCPDVGRGCRTPSGSYTIYQKHGADYVSKKFPVGIGGAPMPYAMFFHGGFAVHGSYHVVDTNASHGCIRVLPSDALWLNKNLLTYGSKVIVLPYR